MVGRACRGSALLQIAWIHFERLLSALGRLVVALVRLWRWGRGPLEADHQTVGDSEIDLGHGQDGPSSAPEFLARRRGLVALHLLIPLGRSLLVALLAVGVRD